MHIHDSTEIPGVGTPKMMQLDSQNNEKYAHYNAYHHSLRRRSRVCRPPSSMPTDAALERCRPGAGGSPALDAKTYTLLE